MSWPLLALGVLALAERAWKHWAVVRFFHEERPTVQDEAEVVSILQPILSGDPTLRESLEHNLRMQDRNAREYIWLVDAEDADAQRICRELIDAHAECRIEVVSMAAPPPDTNPKMVKLIEGAKLARGGILAVLDDDTRLPEHAFEQCLPYLRQPRIGLAFGLPYYVSFQNTWSSLVAYFVNSNSLLTYVPYLQVTKPFTINGMFYAMRREVLDEIGGFAGLEGMLADDFAVAQRVREHGYELAQTPVRHAISTYVTGPGHYFSLMRRWFIFPRESLMRHLRWRELLVFYGLNLLPALGAPGLLLALAMRPSAALAGLTALYFTYSYAICADLNARFLGGASPWRGSWWVPVIQATFPIQVLIALAAPQRIRWRGHVIEARPGGGLRFIQRREENKLQGTSSAEWKSSHDGQSTS